MEEVIATAVETEVLKGLNSPFWDKEDHTKHALFLDELPENLDSDPTVSALRALTEEELKSSKDKCLHWKATGNDHFKESSTYPSRVRDAIDAYTHGLDVPESSEHRQIRAQLYANRANCHYKLHDFVECVEDGKRAIREDPKYAKGYFHAAKGSLALGLLKRASEYCRVGSEKCPEASVLVEIKVNIDKKLCERQSKAAAEQREADRTFLVLKKVMETRGVVYLDKPLYDAPIFKPEISADGLIAWPILLLIEDYKMSEMASAVAESARLLDLLNAMFPDNGCYFPWDTEHSFVVGNIDVYLEDGKEALDTNSLVYSVIDKMKQINLYPVLSLRKRKAI